MTYLLILFVIAIALAPLSHFVPSKRQRQIARMREYAAVHGLFVEFRDVPRRQYQDARQRNPVGHDTIYYGKRLKPSRNRGEGARAWLREEEGFVGLERRLAPPSELAGLPPQVLAAGVPAERLHCELFSPNDWLLG